MTQDELRQVIEEAAQTGAKELDLSGCDLTELPPEIGRLTELETLILAAEGDDGYRGNNLTSLPAEIGLLTNLKTLKALGNFRHKLGWSNAQPGNQLSALPPEIGQLTHLTQLYLSYNQLSALPPEIGQLTHLTQLYLRSNQLSALPPEIVQLTHLTQLYLRSNQLSALPPEIGQLTHLTQLYLSYNQLSALPPEIGQLTHLTQLDLRSNQLSALPPEIVQLTHLTQLDLRSNQLSALPPEIVQLTHLTQLDLRSNQLSALPPEIGQLTNLTQLYLRSNQLSALPPEIVQLTHLTQLDLSYNQLSALPPEIVQLTHLTQLDLSYNQLSALPPEIVQLTNLTQLYLSGNQLSALPPEIVQLTHLTQLYLSGNQLSALPPEIVQLTHLTQLDLSYNQLSALPPEIGQLTNLTQLYLSGNQLSALPPEIVQLTHLTQLYLSGNQLSALPPEIVQLVSLETLDLRGNPVPIPPEVLGPKNIYAAPGNLKEILDFYFQILDPNETEPLYEAKFLIVGEGGAGKTTLAKKIDNADYTLNTEEKSTEGIEVIRWELDLPTGQLFRVNIWDFGGQEIYHHTHQFFLTKRSLYALVADTRQENTDFYYWLKVVELLSDSSPVILIKNEKQDRQCQLNDRQLRSDFPNLKEILATNLATNRGLGEIKQAIQHYVTALPLVGNPLPKIWVRVRSALENYSQHCNYIPRQKYFDLCREFGFTETQPMLQVSSYLHDLGVCLHFQHDAILKHTVILKPEWATTAVYKVCDTPNVKENQGRFTRDDLDEIWSDNQYAAMRDELLQLMKEFKLCYEIPGLPDTFIAPHLLSLEAPDYEWDKTDNLILRYEYDFMPKGMLTRFIVEMHPLIERQVLVWKTGVVLTDGWARAEVIERYRHHKGEIVVRVSGSNKKALLERVRHELWKIHESFEELDYQELIPCNCTQCKGHDKPEFYPYELLQKYLTDRRFLIECRRSYEGVKVRALIDDILQRPTSSSPLSPGDFPSIENRARADLEDWDFVAGVSEAQMIDHVETFQPKKEAFISYAWGGDSEGMANKVDAACQAKGIPLVRDKRDLGFKGLIKDFMRQIGKGKAVIVIISEKYLKSENCMFELLEIAKTGDVYDRIFPIVLNDAKIYKSRNRIRYVQHWENEIQELDTEMKTVSSANLQGFREDIDLYQRIRDQIAGLTDLLRDMNTLTAEIHTESGFADLISAIEQKINE
jgi:internalin A